MLPARLCSLTLLLWLCPLFGQTPATTSLSGRISDPRGARVAGARIELTNQGTGLTRESSTNDEGLYSIASLPPGNYDLADKCVRLRPEAGDRAESECR